MCPEGYSEAGLNESRAHRGDVLRRMGDHLHPTEAHGSVALVPHASSESEPGMALAVLASLQTSATQQFNTLARMEATFWNQLLTKTLGLHPSRSFIMQEFLNFSTSASFPLITKT